LGFQFISMQNVYGLLGRTLSHSFSKGYFTDKFVKLGIENENKYELFEIKTIDKFPDLLKKFGHQLIGLNVTIPYKQEIIPFLDEIDEAAQKIGAVNTIKFIKNEGNKTKLKGYNTDYWGFRWSLEKWVEFNEIKPKKALVLGKGGAAKAVIVALNDLGIEVQLVSRKKETDTITYDALNQELIESHLLIVNSTPLGMYPNTDSSPEIPYQYLTNSHLLYDLVYNPLETQFLKNGIAKNIKAVHYGLEMLHGQAEKAWEIWNKS
jgi:shikimate dehydrogenase